MASDRTRTSDPTLLILTSLASGEKHGYALLRDIEQFAQVTLGPGTLYGAISRLERRGLIEPVAETGRRQPYRLTAEGDAVLRESVAGMRSVVETATARLAAPRSYNRPAGATS